MKKDKELEPVILIVDRETWARIEHYANYTGVSGGWQNLCRKLRGRIVTREQVDDEIEATKNRSKGLFG